MLLELVRAADLHAYFLHCFSRRDATVELMMKCQFIIHGIGPVLKALLPLVEGRGGGMPWPPTNSERAQWADQVLHQAGRLSMLRRPAYSERYGLVRCEVHSDQHFAIHLLGKDDESRDREDIVWLVNKTLDEQRAHLDHLDSQVKGWARNRIDRAVRIDRKHFIRYDSDRGLLNLYQEYVQRFMIDSAESDTFPDDVRIGPRTFGDWKRIATIAAARAALHLSFATRLQALNRGKLDLRNLLTILVRVDDLRGVWREQLNGLAEGDLDEIADVFMLGAKHAEEYFSNHDCPLPYNIRVGRDFVLLPQFGYLANTCTHLVAGLRRKYRKDWDDAVNLREAKFQTDLYELFPGDDYVVGRENVRIRRANGRMETDIDATLFEKSTKCLYLLQLKWLDVFAHNLRERQSKLSNLLDKGNKWVDQVSQWSETTPRSEILDRLGLSSLALTPNSVEIRIVVLTRFSSRFSGAHEYDERAAWLSWPTLCRSVAECAPHSAPLEAAWKKAREESPIESCEGVRRKEYVFQDLRVDVIG